MDRDYVAEVNNQTVMSGVPMMRPMMLEFPADRECYTKPAENQVRLLAASDVWPATIRVMGLTRCRAARSSCWVRTG